MRKIKKIDLILITIILVCITFIFSAFYIFPNRFFLTRYVQIFLDYLTSILARDDPIVYDSFGNLFLFLKGFLLSIHHLTNLEILKVISLPIGFIMFPISIYYFGKTFFKNICLESLIGFSYLIVYFLSAKTLQVSYVASISTPVVFFVSALYMKIMRNENLKKNILLLFISLVYLLGVWHSAAFYGLILMISISAIYSIVTFVILLYNRKHKQPNSSTSYFKPLVGLHLTAGIVIIGIIVFLGKDTFLSGYLDQLVGEKSFAETIVGIFIPMINRLLGKSDLPLDEAKYEFNYATTIPGRISSIANILIHLIAGFVFLMSLIVLTIKSIKNKNSKHIFYIVFGYGLILAQIVYYFLYSASGANFFYIATMFPIIGSFYTMKNKRRKIAAISILAISALGTTITISSFTSHQYGYHPATVYEDNLYAFEWIHTNIPEGSILLLDFNMKDRLIQFNIENNLLGRYNLTYISSINYLYIVNDRPSYQRYNQTTYLIIDRLSMSTNPSFDIFEKRGYLRTELDLINKNPFMSLIFTDYYVSIYNFI